LKGDQSVRNFFVVLLLSTVPGILATKVEAQDGAGKVTLHAVDWIPDSTQGFARIVDFTKFLERWKSTQFGKLADDERLQPFWKDQRKTIEGRFAEAGWKMNVTGDDIATVASGQVAVAWIAKPQVPEKPFAVALVIDVARRQKELGELMNKIDAELKARKATSQKQTHEGAEVVQYTLPRGPGELTIQESFYCVVEDYFVATDELAMLKEIVIAKKKGRTDSLGASSLYKAAMGKLPAKDSESDIEYFIRPIGLAKLLRSISNKPLTSQTDILKVLDKQGFSKLAAVVGRMDLASENFDVLHDAYVLAEPPLPISVQVLDFPNLAGRTAPSWVTANAASYVATAWNAKDAFWKVKGLVDDIAGQEGVFDSVIEGIQTDPVGPQIDLKNQVLPYITSEIFVVSEIIEPVTPDSRRSLIGLRIDDPKGELAAAVDRAMRNEPDATLEDFEEFRIYKVIREEDSDEALNVQTDFGFGDKKKAPPKEEEPLLNNWAIATFKLKDSNGKFEEYLLFASHAEMIKEAITLAKSSNPNSALENQPDVAKVVEQLKKISEKQPSCVWEISRNDRAYRMQYELFRQDKLPQSRSMLATILDRILRPKDELKKAQQNVKGAKLPPFDEIKMFFMPSGSRVVSQADGWAYQGFVLAK
jgi:hypothetical protein